MATIEGLEKVFGKLKDVTNEYREDRMELTTKIINVTDKNPQKRGFQLMINGETVWASIWYSGKSGDLTQDAVDVIKSLRKGDEATFDLYKQGQWWNINSVMPVQDINHETREPEEQRQGKVLSSTKKPFLSIESINICAQVATKEGFATARTAMSAGVEVDPDVIKGYCRLAMDQIMSDTARYLEEYHK